MRNNKIDMVVTLFTTCAVFWLNIMTIFTMKISLPRRRYRGFVKHSSLGPSSTVAEKSEKNIGERSEPIRRLGRMALPPPQSTARLFLLSDFLCPFSPFFAIFPHSGAWSYEVAWISGLPKGLRGGRDNSEIKNPSHVMTSYSLNHTIIIWVPIQVDVFSRDLVHMK